MEDTGIGVPADKLDKLFEAFMQVDASTTREYGGTGVGLAITKKFCEMMGGSTAAESEAGKGTTITIRLPAGTQPERAPATEIPHETPATPTATDIPYETPAMPTAAEAPTEREQLEPQSVF